MKNLNINKSNIKGTINIVSSKSLSHRYLIAASLASGTSKITNVLDSKDLEATTNILRNLGVDISINNNTYTVVSNKLTNLNKDLFANESGSTLRFFIPITLGIKGNHRFTGASSLGSRSLKVYEDLSSYFNYKISKTNNNFPIIVEGELEPGNYYIDGSLSSQFITGLLFSLPLLNKDSNIIFTKKPSSIGYIDLTLEVLNESGIIIEKTSSGYYIKGNQLYKPLNKTIEGDYSQAAFFIVASIITNNKLVINNLNKDSKQGDKEILSIIKNMGVNYEFTNDGLVIIPSKELKSIFIDLKDIPDLGPILMVLASTLENTTTFLNVDRLYDKESNRYLAMKENLEKVGVNFNLKDNTLFLTGVKNINTKVSFDTFNDHRIAMALSVLALINKQETTINDYEVVNKSYPNFYDDLIKIGGKVTYVK